MLNSRILRRYGSLAELVILSFALVFSFVFVKIIFVAYSLINSVSPHIENSRSILDQADGLFVKDPLGFSMLFTAMVLMVAFGKVASMLLSYTKDLKNIPEDIGDATSYIRRDVFVDEVVYVSNQGNFNVHGALFGYLTMGVFGALLLGSINPPSKQYTGKKLFQYSEFIYRNKDGKENRFLCGSCEEANVAEEKMRALFVK